MLDNFAMIVLAGTVVMVLAAIGFYIFSRWRVSRAPSRQRPPEVPTRQWLQREAEQADSR